MTNNGNIFIFSDEIGIGKTTTLLDWVKTSPNITGFLSPVISGERQFLNLESSETRPMETKIKGLEIGKHNFDPEVFTWAENEILKQFHSEKEWLVIDEIGPLEIRKEKGFHQLLLKIFHENDAEKPKLLFVVRDFMVEEFLQKYNIENATILPKNFFRKQELKPLTGVILCGGESRRMGSDKSLLEYQGKPQWKKSLELLQPFCSEIKISINDQQWQKWAKNESEEFIIDLPKYSYCGPLGGVLSVAEIINNTGIFILGVDYPHVKTEHLIRLFNVRDTEKDAVCFQKNGFTEPLISIIEEHAVHKLFEFQENGGISMKKFLDSLNTLRIDVENSEFLSNINTPQEFANFNRNKPV